jgi:hypothetical protein
VCTSEAATRQERWGGEARTHLGADRGRVGAAPVRRDGCTSRCVRKPTATDVLRLGEPCGGGARPPARKHLPRVNWRPALRDADAASRHFPRHAPPSDLLQDGYGFIPTPWVDKVKPWPPPCRCPAVRGHTRLDGIQLDGPMQSCAVFSLMRVLSGGDGRRASPTARHRQVVGGLDTHPAANDLCDWGSRSLGRSSPAFIHSEAY